jgi:hypothetical protein
MIGAYYLVTKRSLASRMPHVDLPMDGRGRRRYIVVGVVAGLGVLVLQTLQWIPSSGNFASITRLLAGQFTIAMVLLAYLWYRKETADIRWAYLMYLAAAVNVLLGLATGFLESTLIPIALIAVVRWHVSRKFPVILLVAGFLAFVILQAVKTDYRWQAWRGNVPVQQRISLWFHTPGQVITDTFSGDILNNSQKLVRSSMARFDFLHTFQLVHSMTPTYVPYYGGSSYEYFVYTWIPRFVWPDKPAAQDAAVRYELDYGLVAPSQLSGVSIGIGLITEAYANFGVLGIMIILALQGALVGALANVFNRQESDGGRAIFLLVTVLLLNGIGSSSATVLGNVVQVSLAGALIIRPFATAWSADSVPGSRAIRRRFSRRRAGSGARAVTALPQGGSALVGSSGMYRRRR